MRLIDIAGNAVMLPLGSVIACWLLFGRARKVALVWCVLFGIGLSCVALSKIAYIGWYAVMPAFGFKALSGHALRGTIVLPVLFFVVFWGKALWLRGAGVASGIMLSVYIDILLVRFKFHTTSEVIASAILGGVLVAGFMRSAVISPAPRVSVSTVSFSLIVSFVMFALMPSTLNHHLVDIALYFSGREQPYTWSSR